MMFSARFLPTDVSFMRSRIPPPLRVPKSLVSRSRRICSSNSSKLSCSSAGAGVFGQSVQTGSSKD